MPPTHAHLNGSVNLPDAETVMRTVASHVPRGLRRMPDGETGDRANWIFYQLGKFWETPGLEQSRPPDADASYQEMPKVRLADGADPEAIDWPDLGYASAYAESFDTFQHLRREGVIPDGVRFQLQYPTPLASISSYVAQEDQRRLEGSYEQAMFADLDKAMAQLPHDQVAVQWDVAVEFALLEGMFAEVDDFTVDDVVARLVRCVDRVPADVPVGLHLCYGDYGHQHFTEPDSLATQVQVVNALAAGAARTVDWFSFTVPQYQRELSFFAPLRELAVPRETELYLALVPYHPDRQEAGTTAEQVGLIDRVLGDRPWGICTECGMGRVDAGDVPRLLDLHTAILAEHGP